MATIQDLTADEAHRVDLDVLVNTALVAKTFKGVKAATKFHQAANGIGFFDLQYAGFSVAFCAAQSAYRTWDPVKDYDKNFFCSYYFSGQIDEFRSDTSNLINTFKAESFVNTSITLDFPTYEHYRNVSWLCLSSYKPYIGSYVRVLGHTIIPAHCGALVILGQLGEFRALEYIEPDTIDHELEGNAKVLLIEHGTFVNVPP